MSSFFVELIGYSYLLNEKKCIAFHCFTTPLNFLISAYIFFILLIIILIIRKSGAILFSTPWGNLHLAIGSKN